MPILFWVDIFGLLLPNAHLWLVVSGLALSLSCVLSLFFTATYLDRRVRVTDFAIFLGIVMVFALTVRSVLNPGASIAGVHFDTHGLAMHAITSSGRLALVFFNLYILGSCFLFMQARRHGGSTYLALSLLIMLSGIMLKKFFYTPFPVLSFSNALCALILAHGVIGKQFFNPLKTRNTQLKSQIEECRRAELALAESEAEKRKLETRLAQAQKMEAIGTLAGGIAHDFNNILSAIMGYTEIAKLKTASQNPVSGYLDEITKAGNRARELIQQILTFSRQSKQDFKPVSVTHILQEALKLIRPSMPANIDIRQNISSDAVIMGNPTQLHQIILNLCTNAGHAMKATGGTLSLDLVEVELTADLAADSANLKPGRYLQISVGDNGHGIPPEILERIFEPFFTTKAPGEGTGMGLAVVHGLVGSHGGAILAESNPGRGTVFKIFLPVIEERFEPENRVAEAWPHGTEHILLVEDEPALIEIGKKMLESLGYRVTTRASSIEALNLFIAQKDRFDLVITDMTMPQMTGEKLAAELIAVRKDIPVILCTGFSYSMAEANTKNLDIKGILLKPIIMSKMARMVRGVLDDAKAPATDGHSSAH